MKILKKIFWNMCLMTTVISTQKFRSTSKNEIQSSSESNSHRDLERNLLPQNPYLLPSRRRARADDEVAAEEINNSPFCNRCLKNACYTCKKAKLILCETCATTLLLCSKCKDAYQALRNSGMKGMEELENLEKKINTIKKKMNSVENTSDKVKIMNKLKALELQKQTLIDRIQNDNMHNNFQILRDNPQYFAKIKIIHSIYILSNLIITALFIVNMNLDSSIWNTSIFLFFILMMIFVNHFFYHLKTTLEMQKIKYEDINFPPGEKLCKGVVTTYDTTRYNFEFGLLLGSHGLWALLGIFAFIPEFREPLGINDCELINGIEDCNYSDVTAIICSIFQIILHLLGIILASIKRCSFVTFQPFSAPWPQ